MLCTFNYFQIAMKRSLNTASLNQNFAIVAMATQQIDQLYALRTLSRQQMPLLVQDDAAVFETFRQLTE